MKFSTRLFLKLAEISVEPNSPAASPNSRTQKYDEADRSRMDRRAHTASHIRKKSGGKSNRKKMAFGGAADPLSDNPLSASASMGVNSRDIPVRGE